MPQEYQHEPELGLACGDDGLNLVRRMLAEAADHLTEKGLLIVEVGNSQVHVEALYPEVDFAWLDFERGGQGVFMLSAEQCRQHQALLALGGYGRGAWWEGGVQYGWISGVGEALKKKNH